VKCDKFQVRELTYIGLHRLVNRSPPDVVFRRVLLDDALVERRAAGLLARVCRESTGGCDGRAGLVDQGIFVESSDGRVGDLRVVSVELSTSKCLRAYNCDTVVVNVRLVVELLLDLGVLFLGSVD
jgi:hypothetical protein